MSGNLYRFFFDFDTFSQDIPNQKIFEPWRLKIISIEEFLHLSLKEQYYYFIYFGLLAPSTHNTVAERFTIDLSGKAIDLYVDRKYVLSESDPVGRQTCISVGCMLTNIAIAAEHYGRKLRCEFYGNKINPYREGEDRYVSVARLSFEQTKILKQTALLKAIVHRKVIRSEYDSTHKLSESLVKKMQKYVRNLYPNATIHFITDKLRIHALAKFEEAALRTVIERESFSLELGQWLIPNEDRTLPYAMRGKEFGFDDAFAAKIHKGLLRQERLLPDEIASFALGGKIMINSSPAIGVITIKEDSVSQQIDAGKIYEYCALLLWQEKFATAVHAGITEVEAINRMFAVFLRTRERPTVVFRIGKPLYPADWDRPHAARPHAEDVLL